MLFDIIQPEASWTLPSIHLQQYMDQLKDQMHPSGPVSGLFWICSYVLRTWLSDMFICCIYLYSRSAASSFVLDLSRFLLFLGQAAQQDKIWWVFCNQHVGATIVFHSRVLHLALFVDSNKEIETNDLFLRQTGWSFVHPWFSFF